MPIAALGAAAVSLEAQVDFKIAGREVQVHSFASQGFSYSNDNNYLSIKTSEGNFAFTDFGASVRLYVSAGASTAGVKTIQVK